jgi:hypothetical protein
MYTNMKFANITLTTKICRTRNQCSWKLDFISSVWKSGYLNFLHSYLSAFYRHPSLESVTLLILFSSVSFASCI